jgi:AraC family transcriptional regulator
MKTKDFSKIEPTIVKMPQMKGYYIRHKGYDKSIKKTWQNFKLGFIQMI